MKMKSISALVLYVKDLDRTVDFYEALGFNFKIRKTARARAYLNWFWLEFLASDKEEKKEFLEEAKVEPKGGGLYIYISVDNIDAFYQELLVRHMKPSSEPRDWPWGNREFVMRDPDGYKLVFFQKK
jgi:catechol 2,3-dioxygenase-like lactoylglutathione lyase family enzyme